MEDLLQFRREMEAELTRILDYWELHAPDSEKGGFIGQVDHNGKRYPDAEKGAVLTSRILWTFSSAYQLLKKPSHLSLATRAFSYLKEYFYDPVNGGTYWSVTADGKKAQTRKQVYGQAFSIYGLSEYYAASGDVEALALAVEIYEKLEDFSYDPEQEGYIEAFSQEWEPLEDMRLGGGGLNAPKTMNTHLHVIEAYVNLYLVWPDIRLRKSIVGLLDVFERHIVRQESHQMVLYSDMDWRPLSKSISFGHDIEASWLLLESAEALHDEELALKWREKSIAMARATFIGLAPDGSMYYEFDPESGHWDKHRQWWVMSEAIVGFLNAWQLSKNFDFLRQMFAMWGFIKKYILDLNGGEWFGGVNDDYALVGGNKISFWKCPYHNARMCLEVIKRIPA
jgi:mannobiose 2-epimerase